MRLKKKIETPDPEVVDRLVLQVRQKRDRLRVQIDENLGSDDPAEGTPTTTVPLQRVFGLAHA